MVTDWQIIAHVLTSAHLKVSYDIIYRGLGHPLSFEKKYYALNQLKTWYKYKGSNFITTCSIVITGKLKQFPVNISYGKQCTCIIILGTHEKTSIFYLSFFLCNWFSK